MASKLAQLQSKAAQASQLVAKHGGSYYRQLLEQNKQCIQVPPTVEKCDLLSKQLLYTRLARFEPCSILSKYHVFVLQLQGKGNHATLV
jgi:F-type H+-transporting ATPase subunit g